MPWTTPNTYVTGQIMRASHFNQDLRDNFNYLNAERPVGAVFNAIGTTAITTTSTSVVLITGMQVTLNITSGRVLVLVLGSFSQNSAGVNVYLYVDGSLHIVLLTTANTVTDARANAMWQVLIDSLSVGNHTFDLRWNVGAATTGTITMDNCPLALTVMEI